MPVILVTQEADIRWIAVQSQPGQIVCETLSQKTLHKKVKILSSSPSTTQTNNNKQKIKKLKAAAENGTIGGSVGAILFQN
jgi:hypothetical protein